MTPAIEEPTPEPIQEMPQQTAWKMPPVELPPEMEMIETRSDLKQDQPIAPVATVAPVRRPRPRQEAPEAFSDEPLIQVETDSAYPAQRSGDTG